MDRDRWQIAFFSLLALFVVAAVGGGIFISSRQSVVTTAQQDAEDYATEAEELESELAETESALETLRDRLRSVRARVTTEQDLEAFATEGLAADGSAFTCLDFRCLEIEATLQFFNDTNEGSPVTCVVEVQHENSKSSHTMATSPYVPPNGEDNQLWYYSSPLSGTEIDTYLIGDCRRSEEPTSGE